MIVNAPPPQLIGRQYNWQRQESYAATSVAMAAASAMSHHHQHPRAHLDQSANQENIGSHFSPVQLFSGPYNSLGPSGYRQPLGRQQQQDQLIFEDESFEVINFCLTGGPKWGFRIRQLDDNRVIVSRVDRGPAAKVGLKVNDEILSVNNVPLSDKPRSLLLTEAEQRQQANSSDKLDPDKESANKPEGGPQAGGGGGSTGTPFMANNLAGSIELSKLDFAYQLITHSSISNKLMLTVKRYMNPEAARISVAASTLSSKQQQQQLPLGQLSQQQPQVCGTTKSSTIAGQVKRMHPFGNTVHYGYKCCECYCDNEASSQSCDEEDEKRLLLQLQSQSRHKQHQQQQQLRLAQQQLEQQQRVAQQQEADCSRGGLRSTQQQQFDEQQQQQGARQQASGRQQSAPAPLQAQAVVCGGHRGQQRAERSQGGDIQVEAEPDEEAPPEVPVRRSSQTGHFVAGVAGHAAHRLQRPPAPPPPPSLQSREQQHRVRHQQQRAPQSSASTTTFDLSQLPRPLLSEHEWRPRQQQGAGNRRPMQPPPPPPPPPPQAKSARTSERKALEKPAPPPRVKSKPPSNIWSPSSSSASQSASVSANESCCVEFELEEESSLLLDSHRQPIARDSNEQPRGASLAAPAASRQGCDGSAVTAGLGDDSAGEAPLEAGGARPGEGARPARELQLQATTTTSSGGAKANAAAVEPPPTTTIGAASLASSTRVDSAATEADVAVAAAAAAAAADDDDVDDDDDDDDGGHNSDNSIAAATLDGDGDADEQSSRKQSDVYGQREAALAQGESCGAFALPAPPSESELASVYASAGQQSSSTVEAAQSRPAAVESANRQRHSHPRQLTSFSPPLAGAARAGSVDRQTLAGQQVQPAAQQLRGLQSPSLSNRQLRGGRSFSIAAATLAGPHAVASVESTASGQQQREEQTARVGDQAAQQQTKYWTLPSSAATESSDSRQRAEASAAATLANAMAAGQQQQQQQQQQKQEIKLQRRESAEDGGDAELGGSNEYSSVVRRVSHEADGGSKRKSADLAPSFVVAADENARDGMDTPDLHNVSSALSSSQDPQTELYFGPDRRVYGHQQQLAPRAGLACDSASMDAQRYETSAGAGATSSKEEWFRQMYKQMHKQTPEKGLLRAVNSQPGASQVRIKLKSPKSDHRHSPSYYSEESFERRARDKNSASPTFKPGSICDYLPGQSSIAQHERNLTLYYKLIDHIDRVFSSVLQPELAYHSRSTNTLQAIKHRSSSGRRERQAHQSRSGPQTPVTGSLNRRGEFYQEPLKNGNDHDDGDGGADPDGDGDRCRARRHQPRRQPNSSSGYTSEHERKCVFSQMLRDQHEPQDEQELRLHLQQQQRLAQAEADDDPRKQYVAVQQGRDIPLKGLRKPAPQPNVYKAGLPFDRMATGEQSPVNRQHHWSLQAQYLDYSRQLGQTLQHKNSSSSSSRAKQQQQQQQYQPFDAALQQQSSTSAGFVGSRAQSRSACELNVDDIYRDFDCVYESMRRQPARIERRQQQQQTGDNNGYNAEQSTWSREVEFESEALARSLAEVEEALRRATSSQPPSRAGASQLQINQPQSPAPCESVAASEQTTRADSRNTNQSFSQNGPALVEEMTLSDLEDEISSSLMATKEAANSKRRYFSDGAQLSMKSRRNRNPLPLSLSMRYNSNTLQPPRAPMVVATTATPSGYHSDTSQPTLEDHMFSDESINIHYKAPTSKLLKMNTFNEFELNRIKKLYNDELASRLQRSKSSRFSSCSQSNTLGRAGGQQRGHAHHHQYPFGAAAGEPAPINFALPPNQQQHFHEQRRRAQSAERLLGPPKHQQPALALGGALLGRQFREQAPECGPHSPIVDLNRYQHAFLAKRSASAGSQSRQRRTARLGRALFDFQAKSGRELSLRRGDLLELLELIDHTWARVEDCQSGLQGLVPLNYIDYSVGCAVAKRDIIGQRLVVRSAPRAGEQAQGELLLPMNKGEPITLIRRLSGNWYEASNTRRAVGLAWSTDLDVIKQPVLGRDCSPSSSARRELSLSTGSRSRATSAGCGLAGEYEGDFSDGAHDRMFAGSGYRASYALAAGIDADDDADDEEEMFILDSGERVLARRRARSASSGREQELQRIQRARAAATAAAAAVGSRCTCCCRPVADPAATQSGQTCAGCCAAEMAALEAGAVQAHCLGQAPRRSSSSPYISASAGQQQPGPLVQTSTKTTTTTISKQHQYHHHERRQFEVGGLADDLAGQQKQSSQQQQVGHELPRLCRAKYAYKPRQKDELELVVGDILMVVHECDDGWFIGSSYTTKEMGTFPGNFVEPA